MIYIHIIPAASVFLNILISRIVFIFEHVKFMIVYSFVYLGVNYIGTAYLGKPLYPFLPWTDYMSLVVGMVITIANVIIYFGVCELIKLTKKKPSDYKTFNKDN